MGQKYGKWEVVESIGQGGQAHVFKVIDKTVDPPIYGALKRLINVNRIERFRKEIDAIGLIENDSVVKVIDVDTVCDKPYFVAELVDGPNLRDSDILSWPIERRLEFFRHLVAAMSVVHSQSIVHRDLKPENILIGNHDRPKIIDFGLCYVEDGQRVTVTEEAVGSRLYMAPEFEGGAADFITQAADVYSLGKVLYWLITGRDLPRERYRDPQYALDSNYPNPAIRVFDDVFDMSIVDNQQKRVKNASDLLAPLAFATKTLLSAINLPRRNLPQRCIYCGVGRYGQPYQKRDDDQRDLISSMEMHNKFGGLTNVAGMKPRPLICENCGNVQWFDLRFVKSDAWK